MSDERPSKQHTGPRAYHEDKTEEQRQAGADLLIELLTLYSTARINAKQFCHLCHMCDRAGVQGGAFSHYAFLGENPQRHLDLLSPRDGETLDIEIPANINRSATRSRMPMHLRMLLASLERELQDDKSIMGTLTAAKKPEPKIESVLDTPSYRCHPEVLKAQSENRAPPVPLAVYLGGVRFIAQAAGRQETVLGLWCHLGCAKEGDARDAVPSCLPSVQNEYLV